MIIIDSHGGNVAAFEEIASDLNRRGELLVIDGPCRSACTIMVDQTKRVCVTRRARFGFHWFQTFAGKKYDPIDMYSPRMQLLVKASIRTIKVEYQYVPFSFLREQYRMCTLSEIIRGK